MIVVTTQSNEKSARPKKGKCDDNLVLLSTNSQNLVLISHESVFCRVSCRYLSVLRFFHKICAVG